MCYPIVIETINLVMASPKTRKIIKRQVISLIKKGKKQSEISETVGISPISDIHDGSVGEIRKGYFTVEAAVLSKDKKMPMPVYEKVFLLTNLGLTENKKLCMSNKSVSDEIAYRRIFQI